MPTRFIGSRSSGKRSGSTTSLDRRLTKHQGRAPLAAAPPPSQVAVEPDAPQRPLGAGGAVADLLLAALHRPLGTAERGRGTTGLRFSSRLLHKAPSGGFQLRASRDGAELHRV